MQAGFGSQPQRKHLHGSRWVIGIAATILLLLAACVPTPRPAAEPAGLGGARLPPIVTRTGPLAIDLVYPSEGWEVRTDSTFVFGNVGTGGAEIVETRPDTAAVALGDRPARAAREQVDLLVSAHNNAFPDGVNPFVHAGTSVFYNQPQSLGLARAVQNELLREFELPDLGIARADLALVRPSAFPSLLTETMFLMVPEQENALRDPGVQERIARAHLRRIEAFLRERAAEQ